MTIQPSNPYDRPLAEPAAPPPAPPVGTTIQPVGPLQGLPRPPAPVDALALKQPGGDPTTVGLPEAAANAQPVAAFETVFGEKSYVKDGADAELLGLARRAMRAAPELAAGRLADGTAAGSLGPESVKAMQKMLEDRGYPVGDTGVDGKYGPRTHRALRAFLNGEAPERPPTPAPAPDGTPPGPEGTPPEAGPTDVAGQGQTKDGHRIPGSGEGRATVFANGHISYKGWNDKGNMQNKGIGAWGDKCAPTEYFCALPVGLDGTSGKWWHNQRILVTNPANGKQVVVRVQDKGPHPSTGNAIDLSPVAMEALGGKFNGALGKVKFEFAPADAAVGPVGR